MSSLYKKYFYNGIIAAHNWHPSSRPRLYPTEILLAMPQASEIGWPKQGGMTPYSILDSYLDCATWSHAAPGDVRKYQRDNIIQLQIDIKKYIKNGEK